MAQKEVIVYAKISFVGPDHVAFATIADKGQGTKNVTVTRDKFSSVFDVDNGRGVLCYKGTNRTITSGDKVTLYFPSLKDNSITKILYVEERQDQISSLLKQDLWES